MINIHVLNRWTGWLWWEFGPLFCVPDRDDIWNKRTKNRENIPSRFALNRKQKSLLFYLICVQYTKFWLEFGIINICTNRQFIWSKKVWLSVWEFIKLCLSQPCLSTRLCMLRTEILITFNITCMWTFHTNSLLHETFEYLFLMHVRK